jgi:hypothetical protein
LTTGLIIQEKQILTIEVKIKREAGNAIRTRGINLGKVALYH